jgi:hypothetical protein
MGLRACALYDYQAGKLPEWCAILAVIYESVSHLSEGYV